MRRSPRRARPRRPACPQRWLGTASVSAGSAGSADWRYTPTTALSAGTHILQAELARAARCAYVSLDRSTLDDWDLGELIPEARGANVALNKPVRVVPQRDCGPGWSASLLVDASNGWSHSYGAADQAVTGWLQVDLGASQAVNRATLLGLMTAPNADASILRVSAEHLQGTQVRLSGTSPVSTVGGVSRAMSRPEGQSMAFVSQW